MRRDNNDEQSIQREFVTCWKPTLLIEAPMSQHPQEWHETDRLRFFQSLIDILMCGFKMIEGKIMKGERVWLAVGVCAGLFV